MGYILLQYLHAMLSTLMLLFCKVSRIAITFRFKNLFIGTHCARLQSIILRDHCLDAHHLRIYHIKLNHTYSNVFSNDIFNITKCLTRIRYHCINVLFSKYLFILIQSLEMNPIFVK